MPSKYITIKKVLNIASDMTKQIDKSCHQLFLESGYLDFRETISTNDLIELLNPTLIECWLNYSADQRSSDAWYFLYEEDKYRLGTSAHDDGKNFENPKEPCACFIMNLLKQLQE